MSTPTVIPMTPPGADWSARLYQDLESVRALQRFATGGTEVLLCIFCRAIIVDPLRNRAMFHQRIGTASIQVLELPDGVRLELPPDQRLVVCTGCARTISPLAAGDPPDDYPKYLGCGEHCGTLVLLPNKDVYERRCVVERAMCIAEGAEQWPEDILYGWSVTCLSCLQRLAKDAKKFPYTAPRVYWGPDRLGRGTWYRHRIINYPPEPLPVCYDPNACRVGEESLG